MHRLSWLFAMIVIALTLCIHSGAYAGECSLSRPSGIPDYSPPPKTEAEAFDTPFLHFSNLSSRQLLIWGGVCAGDEDRVKALFQAIKVPNEITFISPGGDLGAGMEIGKLIRTHHVTTRIRANTICASSCNFMFLGGFVRIVEPGGNFVVHMFANAGVTKEDDECIQEVSNIDAIIEKMKSKDQAFKMSKEEIIAELLDDRKRSVQEEAAQVASLIGRYLLEMQLSLRFLTTFAKIPNAHARPLTRAELKSFNIINVDE